MNTEPKIYVIPNGIKRPKGIVNNEMFSLKVDVTPKIAKQWLTKNKTNRALSKSRLEFYTNQIKAEEWQLNGESIKFDWNGNLIDGQHRLTAILEADKSITTYVVFGCDPEAFKTIDTGKARSDSDVLKIAGYENTALMASIIRMAMEYKADKYKNAEQNKRLQITHKMILDYALAHKNQLNKAVEYTVKNYSNSDKLLTPKLMGGLYYIFSNISEVDTIDFMNKVCMGIGDLDRFDPIRLLRKRLIDNRSSYSKLPTIMIIILVFKTWNLYRNGDSIKHLRLSKTEEIILV